MNTAFLIHVFEVEIELLLIVERQKEILFGLGIFMIEAVKHFLDIRSFGITVIWTAGRNDGDLQLPAGRNDQDTSSDQRWRYGRRRSYS